MAKVTFSLDDETVRLLRALAERQQRPQSLVVREAIAAYAARDEKLSDAERERKLAVLETLASARATRSATDVEQELRGLRRGRRVGWQRASD
jgi:predicted transcriptional regulator